MTTFSQATEFERYTRHCEKTC